MKCNAIMKAKHLRCCRFPPCIVALHAWLAGIYGTQMKFACAPIGWLLAAAFYGHVQRTNIDRIYSNWAFFVGAAPAVAAPTVVVLGHPLASRPYKSNSRGGWCQEPPLQMGRFRNRSYKPIICSNGLVGAAAKTASTNSL
jgi:hypothetical protein